MMINITVEEREALLELLEAKRKAMLHELHHTDTNDYKNMLRQRIDIIEGLITKVESLPSV